MKLKLKCFSSKKTLNEVLDLNTVRIDGVNTELDSYSSTKNQLSV